jgi:hypothetical protein
LTAFGRHTRTRHIYSDSDPNPVASGLAYTGVYGYPAANPEVGPGRIPCNINAKQELFHPSPHLYWFGRLVNSEVFSTLSQRRSFSFCQRDTSRRPVSVLNRASRYRAVNVTNQTAEVRIWRGSVRWDRVMKCVQGTIAAVEFTRTLNSRRWRDNIGAAFCRWVHEHAATYPHLTSYMTECGLLVASDVIPAGEPQVVTGANV